MPTHRVTASAIIHAPPAVAYGILADYRDGHPRILPKPEFTALTVEEGGVGAGTVVFVAMRVLGRTQSFRAAITEPEPGRVLVETSLDGPRVVTTFTVDPETGGRQARVTITTDTEVRGGVLGAIQGWLTTRVLAPLYARELRQLDAVATGRDDGAA